MPDEFGAFKHAFAYEMQELGDKIFELGSLLRELRADIERVEFTYAKIAPEIVQSENAAK
jgi:hypothetical protein